MGNWACTTHGTFMDERSTPCPYCEILRLRNELEDCRLLAADWKIIADKNADGWNAANKENAELKRAWEIYDQTTATLADSNDFIMQAREQLRNEGKGE